MNTKYITLGFLLCQSMSTSATNAHDIWNSMMEEMDRFHHRINNYMGHMRQKWANLHEVPDSAEAHHAKLSVEEKAEVIQISLSNLELPNENFKATLTRTNNLEIETPISKLTIDTRGRFYSVQHTQSKTVTTDKKTSACTEYCQQVGRTASHEIDLEGAAIHYNKITKTLTITIPLKNETETARITKEIPIHIK